MLELQMFLREMGKPHAIYIEPFGGPDMVPFIARMQDCTIEMVPPAYYGTLVPVLSTLMDNPGSSTGCC